MLMAALTTTASALVNGGLCAPQAQAGRTPERQRDVGDLLSAPGVASTGTPDDEFRPLEHDTRHGRTRPAQHEIDRPSAHRGEGLLHGGQRRVEERGVGRPVERDDGDVVGDTQVELPQRVQEAECLQVGAAEDSSRRIPPVEEAKTCAIAPFTGEGLPSDGPVHHPGLARGLEPSPFSTFYLGKVVSDDQGDGTVAVLS